VPLRALLATMSVGGFVYTARTGITPYLPACFTTLPALFYRLYHLATARCLAYILLHCSCFCCAPARLPHNFTHTAPHALLFVRTTRTSTFSACHCGYMALSFLYLPTARYIYGHFRISPLFLLGVRAAGRCCGRSGGKTKFALVWNGGAAALASRSPLGQADGTG